MPTLVYICVEELMQMCDTENLLKDEGTEGRPKTYD